MSSSPLRILLVDREPEYLSRFQPALTDAGFAVEFFPREMRVAAYSPQRRFDLILLDVRAFPAEIVQTVRQFRQQQPGAQLILITSRDDAPLAIQATKHGAQTFLEKPLSTEKLLDEIDTTVQRHQLEKEMRRSKVLVEAERELLGHSAAMEHLRRQIAKAAPTDARILISGENGTGKELVAAAIHAGSRRADKPFVKVNCAAIPRTLIESELFGHEKGAFTGAHAQRIGLIEEAEGGTLLLDEVADLAPETQAKLLRVMQENEFIRVGGNRPIAFDVRILTATNKNLHKMVRENKFRSDLFFRLNVIPIQVPALRERPEDIALLAPHFLAEAGKNRLAPPALTREALALLQRYTWPGNIRELRNFMERAAIMIDRECIDAADLKRIMPDLENPSLQVGTGGPGVGDGQSLKERMAAYEKQLLQDAYRRSKGNVSKMARLLKTDRANLHRKLTRYKIR